MKKLVVILLGLSFVSFIAVSRLDLTFATDNLNKNTISITEDNLDTNDNTIHSEYSDDKVVSDVTPTNKTTTTTDTSTDSKLNTNTSVDDQSNTDDISNSNIKNDINIDNTNTDVVVDDLNSDDIIHEESTTVDISEKVDEALVVNDKALNKDDALNMLNDMNPNLTYEYMGDENTFSTLKDKGLS
ncbi:MAG: hypothetical protein ACRCXT_20280, partial [Paraclostridium sp.]